MILGLIAFWILALAMVGGLCLAARRGDVEQCGQERRPSREWALLEDSRHSFIVADASASGTLRAEHAAELTGAREVAA